MKGGRKAPFLFSLFPQQVLAYYGVTDLRDRIVYSVIEVCLMRKVFYGLAAVVGALVVWIYITVSEDNKRELAEHPCINNYKQCRSLKEMIEFYPPVNDGRILCTVAADHDLKYGAPEWPSFMEGPKFGAHLIEDKVWKSGQITLIQQGALIPNAFGGKEKRNMFCKYDLNTKKIISFYLE